MGDFFTPSPSGFTGPPEPDIEAPDLFELGKNVAIGLDKSGMVGSFLNGLKEVLIAVVGGAVGVLLRIVGSVLAFIIANINSADEVAGPAYAGLVAQELESLFGVKASTSALQGVANSKSRAQLGDQVGAFMLQNIFAPSSPASGSGVEPSDAAAKKFLGSVMTMEVEGWLHAWIFDAISYHELEKFGELKDGIARTLGLGRMSRQVFAPPLKVFVHDPYLAKLNEAYRPAHLPEASAIRQFFRGEISREELSVILGRQGIREQYIEYLINEHQKYLSDADIDYLIAHGTWTQEQGVKYLAEQGWDTATADRRLTIMRDQRIDKYRREIVAAGEAAYHAGEIPSDQLRTIVQASGLSDDEQTWIMRVAGVKRELHATHLSRGDVETMIKHGVLNFGDLQQWAIRNQMPIEEERYLELLLAVEESKATEAARAKAEVAKERAAAKQEKLNAAVKKAAAAKAQAPDKGIGVSEAETLVLDGIWTFDHLTTYLQARDYSPDAIDAIEHVLHNKIAKAAANATAAAGARTAAAAKGLNLATMERAVVEGLINIDQFSGYLKGQGFTAADAEVLIELTQHAAEVAQVKTSAKATATAKAAAKEVSLPTLERAVRLGLVPKDTYTHALFNAGFDDSSIAVLSAILDSEIAADKANAAKRAQAAAAAGQRNVSLGQMESEVLAGARPIGDYTQLLASLGYSATDQQALTAVLQQRIDHQADLLHFRAAVGDVLGQRGASLSQLERAVKLGQLSIDTYKLTLQQAGFRPDQVTLLANTLLAEIGAAKQASTKAAGASKQLAKKGISLSQLEQAVLQGVQPIEAYTNMLLSAGYDESAAQTLTDLLASRLAHQNDVEAFKAAVGAEFGERGASLIQLERAVKLGTLAIEDYALTLEQAGYRPDQIELLVNTLNAEIAAAKKTPKSGSGSGPANAPPAG